MVIRFFFGLYKGGLLMIACFVKSCRFYVGIEISVPIEEIMWNIVNDLEFSI